MRRQGQWAVALGVLLLGAAVCRANSRYGVGTIRDANPEAGTFKVLYEIYNLQPNGFFKLVDYRNPKPRVVAGDPKSKSNKLVANTHHMLKLANGHIYGLNGSGTRKGGDMTPGAVMQVSTPDGKIIATSTIPELPLSDADRAIIRQTSSQWKTGSKGWGSFSYSGSDTFTFGPDCVIIRGNSRLYCFGKSR
jgi:hypothetical protein